MTAKNTCQAEWLGSVKSSAVALVVAMSASACVVVPVVDMRAEVPCELATRQVTLDVQQIASLGGCYGDACLAQLVIGGVVFATSLVVSGSVAIVGNTMHWIERARKCGRGKSQDYPAGPPGPPQAPEPASPGPTTVTQPVAASALVKG